MNKKQFIEIIKPLAESIDINKYKEKYQEWIIENPTTNWLNFPIAYRWAFPNISVYRDWTVHMEYHHKLKNWKYKTFIYPIN